MRYPTQRVLSAAFVCLFVWCGAAFGEEDVERMFEITGRRGSLDNQASST